MKSIITGDLNLNYQSEEVEITFGNRTRKMRTQGLVYHEEFPNLNNELGVLTVWCAAEDPKDRPTLEEVWDNLFAIKNRLENKDTERERIESNESIRDIIQMFILDADTGPL